MPHVQEAMHVPRLRQVSDAGCMQDITASAASDDAVQAVHCGQDMAQ